MKRFRTIVFALTICAAATFSLASNDSPQLSLYERIAARLAADPAFARAIGQPPPELRDMRWLVGRWNVTSRVFATQSTPERLDHGQSIVEEIVGGVWLQSHDSYHGKSDGHSFLTYNSVSRQWISVTIDRYGHAVTVRTDRWNGNRLIFVAPDVTILGERATLRQTMEKRSDQEYRILNEEQLSSGRWFAVDEYVYTKRK
jgi:hypothetical protein